jgi:hypothetical protein
MKMKEVPFYSLKPGDWFSFQDDEYMKIETIDRCRDYAVNMTTHKLTYFYASEGGVFVEDQDD